MAESQLGILAGFVAYLIIVYVHEWGHYAVGRWVVGIPASEIKIVMSDFPQHVALRDGNEWLGTDQQERYEEVFQGYDPNHERSTVSVFDLYAGGGVLFQGIGVAFIAGGLLLAGEPSIAELFVDISVIMIAAYVVLDVFSVVLSDRLFSGDFYGHWHHSPVGTLLLLAIFAALNAPFYLVL